MIPIVNGCRTNLAIPTRGHRFFSSRTQRGGLDEGSLQRLLRGLDRQHRHGDSPMGRSQVMGRGE